MSQKVCCVPECPVTIDDGLPLHRFPNPKTNADKFQSWISNISGEITTLDHVIIYNNKRVCRRHFENAHLYPNNRLCKLAIPVLHIPGLLDERVTEHIHHSTSGAQQIKSEILISDCHKSHEETLGLPTQTQSLGSKKNITLGGGGSCAQHNQFKVLLKQIKKSKRYKASLKNKSVVSIDLLFLNR